MGSCDITDPPYDDLDLWGRSFAIKHATNPTSGFDGLEEMMVFNL